MVLEARKLLRRLRHEIRIPTATWLLMDCLDLIPSEARRLLDNMKDMEIITIDNGGWIKVK